MMRNVILHVSMTLDGFVAGPNGEMEWLAIDQESWQTAPASANS
jgi:hypothetical protein